jgi:choline dehydrogenase-like flavoprotein
MGVDPDRSVVNEWGRCHDVKNLFIVDGSIWGYLRRREPYLYHPGSGALHRRQHQEAPGDTVRLNPGLRPLWYPDWNGLNEASRP